ncbi:MAG: Rid family hydrolase [Dokdonella sp.]
MLKPAKPTALLAISLAMLAGATIMHIGVAGARSADQAPATEYYPMAHPPAGMTPPFSEAVRVGDLLYLSGEIGIDKGKLVEGGIAVETKQVMDNIGANLARHGSSFDRVIQCTVALADIKDWPAFNETYRGYFTKHFPARMAYATGGLALGARVEVQCNATTAVNAR